MNYLDKSKAMEPPGRHDLRTINTLVTVVGCPRQRCLQASATHVERDLWTLNFSGACGWYKCV